MELKLNGVFEVPKYTYVCTTCNLEIQKFASIKDKYTPCDCGETMNRKMPNLSPPKVTEVIDKYSGTKHIEDQDKVREARKLDYYWKHEVPKMVDSGVYGLDTMIEQGWVFYDEKHNLITRTKPPQRE